MTSRTAGRRPLWLPFWDKWLLSDILQLTNGGCWCFNPTLNTPSVTTNTRGVPLVALGKRYTRRASNQPVDASRPGVALLFAHGTGFRMYQDVSRQQLTKPLRQGNLGTYNRVLIWGRRAPHHSRGVGGWLPKPRRISGWKWNQAIRASPDNWHLHFSINSRHNSNSISLDIWEYANALGTFRRQLIHQDKVIIVAHSAGAVAG